MAALAKMERMSPEEQFWIEADRSALNSILVGGNHLVRKDQVESGAIIGHPVTARRLKVDQATGELDKFKSRHAFDGNRMSAGRARLGLPPPPTGTCNIIDDFGFKIMCGDGAQRHRHFAKADVGDDYVNGKRARAKGYMYMPETVKQYDADGMEMVICLVTPLWGETEAGFEWDIELHEGLLAIGWRQCEGVPAMYYFDSHGHDCRLVEIVDDLFFCESDAQQEITKATIAALTERYKTVSHDLDPTSFAGYKLTVKRQGSAATTMALSQERKVIEATRKYLPQLLTDVPTTGILEGKALLEQHGSLKLPDASQRTAKLSTEARTADHWRSQILRARHDATSVAHGTPLVVCHELSTEWCVGSSRGHWPTSTVTTASYSPLQPNVARQIFRQMGARRWT